MSWRWVLYPPFDLEEWPQGSKEEIGQAEGLLHELREHERAVRDDLRFADKTSLAEWSKARTAVLEAEAEVARLRGEEYALRLAALSGDNSGERAEFGPRCHAAIRASESRAPS